jgi:hypothetical protein
MKFFVKYSRLADQAELLAVVASGQSNRDSARPAVLDNLRFLWSPVLILLAPNFLAHSPVLFELANRYLDFRKQLMFLK